MARRVCLFISYSMGVAILLRSFLWPPKREFSNLGHTSKSVLSWTKHKRCWKQLLGSWFVAFVWEVSTVWTWQCCRVRLCGPLSVSSRASADIWKLRISVHQKVFGNNSRKLSHWFRLPSLYNIGVTMLPRSSLWNCEREFSSLG